jgi:copper chaperone CopZ
MKLSRLMALATLGVALVLTGAGWAETKLEVKGTHLCCKQCVTAVGEIIKKVDGVSAMCDQKAGTITITAKDNEAAQKALDALAAGGFHGDTGNKDLKFKDDSGVAAGKVKTLTLTGVHNCCGNCDKAIKATVGKVAGVTGNTSKARSDTFDVTGEFDAAELVKALNAAGYHVKVKK